ncbi:hypothetical protein [Vibrio parahaemolyticus]|uniref:hypothetical protein n=1 Tax=Vibrio parahaemolyticus TaxID=670 RepID=UPI00111E0EA9|nr:hypothetical protein [Vibrio parahaemolyticus]
MFQYLKLATITIFLFTPLAYTGYLLFDGRYWGAGAAFFTFIFFVYLLISNFEPGKEIGSTLGLVILVFSAVQAFSSSPAMDFELQKKNIALMSEVFKTQYCPYELQPDDKKRDAFRELHSVAVNKCVLQSNTDMLNLTFELSKGRYLDPVSGLVDGIYNDFIDGSKPVTCVGLAKTMDNLCPNIFITKL